MIRLAKDGLMLTIKARPVTIILGLTKKNLYLTCTLGVRYKRKKKA